ncbi:MAG: maltose acetyltransferase domain-containing protein, partial [Prevotella histicola]
MKSERQKALDGEFFNAVDPELQQIILRTKRLLRKLNDCDYADHGHISSHTQSNNHRTLSRQAP